MKYWQILCVLGDENAIIEKYFRDPDLIKGAVEVDGLVVEQALRESNKDYYVTSHGYLRMLPEPSYLREQGITMIEKLTVLEACNKYGGDAITEVIDYGSFDLSRL